MNINSLYQNVSLNDKKTNESNATTADNLILKFKVYKKNINIILHFKIHPSISAVLLKTVRKIICSMNK